MARQDTNQQIESTEVVTNNVVVDNTLLKMIEKSMLKNADSKVIERVLCPVNKGVVGPKFEAFLHTTVMLIQQTSKTTDIEVGDDTFKVREYSVPSVGGLKELCLFSGKIAISAQMSAEHKFFGSRKSHAWDANKVMTPDDYKAFMATFDSWVNKESICNKLGSTDISKEPKLLSEFAAIYENESLVVINELEDKSVDRALTQLLGVKIPFVGLGEETRAISEARLLDWIYPVNLPTK